MRSTDVDRTLMSAETQMSALFYPTPAQQFNATIFWQPVPVHTKPVDDDFVSVITTAVGATLLLVPLPLLSPSSSFSLSSSPLSLSYPDASGI